MNDGEVTFRSARFGGFHRGDVLDYIRKITSEHRTEQEELLRRLEESDTERERLRSGLSGLDEVRGRLAGAEEANKAVSAENQRLLQENAVLNEQLSRLQTQLEQWEPNIATLGAIRSQMADIELDARERGSRIVERASHQGEEIRQRADQAVQHTAARYDQVRLDCTASLDRMRTELRRLEGELDGLNQVMKQDSQELFSICDREEDKDHE